MFGEVIDQLRKFWSRGVMGASIYLCALQYTRAPGCFSRTYCCCILLYAVYIVYTSPSLAIVCLLDLLFLFCLVLFCISALYLVFGGLLFCFVFSCFMISLCVVLFCLFVYPFVCFCRVLSCTVSVFPVFIFLYLFRCFCAFCFVHTSFVVARAPRPELSACVFFFLSCPLRLR